VSHERNAAGTLPRDRQGGGAGCWSRERSKANEEHEKIADHDGEQRWPETKPETHHDGTIDDVGEDEVRAEPHPEKIASFPVAITIGNDVNSVRFNAKCGVRSSLRPPWLIDVLHVTPPML
jgi:hypothetical protein